MRLPPTLASTPATKPELKLKLKLKPKLKPKLKQSTNSHAIDYTFQAQMTTASSQLYYPLQRQGLPYSSPLFNHRGTSTQPIREISPSCSPNAIPNLDCEIIKRSAGQQLPKTTSITKINESTSTSPPSSACLLTKNLSLASLSSPPSKTVRLSQQVSILLQRPMLVPATTKSNILRAI